MYKEMEGNNVIFKGSRGIYSNRCFVKNLWILLVGEDVEVIGILIMFLRLLFS